MWVITALYWVMLLTGLFLSGAFLVLHRPKNWFRSRAVNATGWVIMIFVLFLRAIVVVILKQNFVPQFNNPWEIVFSLGLGFFVDFLLAIRIKSFLNFRRDPAAYLKAMRISEDAEN